MVIFKIEHAKMIPELQYEVAAYTTYSKIDAFRAAQGDVSKIKLNFMRSTFGSNRFARPLLPWHNLLRTRCQQLRDQYRWLTLWFSGGWDSTTVLDAFVTNGIHIDEIAVYQRTWFQDVEVIPALQYAESVKQNHMPGAKITHVQIDHCDFDSVYNKLGSDWIFAPGCSVMYPKMHRHFLHQDVDSTLSVIERVSDRADIYAQDKPRVMLSDGVWCNFAVDNGLYQYMDTDCEFFYLTPDLPDLHVAQCHMAIDHFEQVIRLLGKEGLEHFHRIQGNKCLDWQYEAWNQAIGRSCIDNVSARHGRMKARVSQNPHSEESTTALDRISDDHHRALRIYKIGLDDIAAITGRPKPIDGNADWLPVILSDWYPIRPLANDIVDLLRE